MLIYISCSTYLWYFSDISVWFLGTEHELWFKSLIRDISLSHLSNHPSAGGSPIHTQFVGTHYPTCDPHQHTLPTMGGQVWTPLVQVTRKYTNRDLQVKNKISGPQYLWNRNMHNNQMTWLTFTNPLIWMGFTMDVLCYTKTKTIFCVLFKLHVSWIL